MSSTNLRSRIASTLSQAIALGKRKASPRPYSSSSDDGSDSQASTDEFSDEEPRPSGSVTPSDRRYPCTYEKCRKAYTKLSRLSEHLRSHTGERPYTCNTCAKSYLRDTHLQAHIRSHLPPSARPHECSEKECTKRFWTKQHLAVHIARVHHQEKPFSCVEQACSEAFAKHNQLKRHIAEKHSPPGTMPFRCENQGCTKSFATTQKLRKHSKVHQDNRYACIDPKCASHAPDGSPSPLYFPTWTALQGHIRKFHPPTCPHPGCGGRIFGSQKGLKGHLKLHEEREIETALDKVVMGEDYRPIKRRRGGEIGRDWACEVEECTKAFKSKKALTTHQNITHLGRRDHVCEHSECGATFGYKHLLQRHTAKVHSKSVVIARVDSASEAEDEENFFSIEWLTGKSYGAPSTQKPSRAPVPCPWPNRFDESGSHNKQDTAVNCAYLFSRAYDLRRHLKAEHGLALSKDEVDGWVQDWRECHPGVDTNST